LTLIPTCLEITIPIASSTVEDRRLAPR